MSPNSFSNIWNANKDQLDDFVQRSKGFSSKNDEVIAKILDITQQDDFLVCLIAFVRKLVISQEQEQEQWCYEALQTLHQEKQTVLNTPSGPASFSS